MPRLKPTNHPRSKREFCGSESAIGCANLYAMENGGGARLDRELMGQFEIGAVRSWLPRGTANV